MRFSKEDKIIFLIFLISSASFVVLMGLALDNAISNSDKVTKYSRYFVIPTSLFFIGVAWSGFKLIRKTKFWRRR